MAKNNSTPTQLPLPIDGATVEIQLTKGYIAIVDAIDSDLVAYNWYARGSRNLFYASRHTSRRISRHSGLFFIMLHRVILERKLGRTLDKKEFVDHINCNTMDNRRKNLRVASIADNCRNVGLTVSNKSGYKGVHWHKRDKRWRAQIRINGKVKYLGNFHTPEEAYAVYCEAAKKYHGEFARLEQVPMNYYTAKGEG